MRTRFYLLFIGGLLALSARAQSDAYLFSYFTGNGEDGLHLAYSTDGKTWTALNGGKSLLKPNVGGEKLMRDPCILPDPDGQTFRMVYTTGWKDKGIGYATSTDLVNWSEQRFLPVMQAEPETQNCWAPEVAWDPETKKYFILWASTVKGKFPQTEQENGNHRIYATRTTDFQTFTPAKVYYNRQFNVIDATMQRDGDRWVMFLKDETEHPFPEQKNIRVATSDGPNWPWSAPSAKITGNYWAEGPTALKIGDRWMVYFDKYKEGKMGCVTSTDLKTWQDVSDTVRFPPGTRHGTAFRVKREVLDKLMTLGK